MRVLEIPFPEELLAEFSLNREALESLAREALLVRLYERGEISSGKAAQLLGISRRAFLDLLGQYHVSEFGEELDLEAEVRRAHAARDLKHESTD